MGKTIQLAMSAQLMALYGDKPVLILVPKTLIWQWQDEMDVLLDLPSAVWDGRQWIDESEGINLQTLGTLINLDLPWNPTRLEQRKGRIQRIGQVREQTIPVSIHCLYIYPAISSTNTHLVLHPTASTFLL